jgi:hypothetical protein
MKIRTVRPNTLTLSLGLILTLFTSPLARAEWNNKWNDSNSHSLNAFHSEHFEKDTFLIPVILFRDEDGEVIDVQSLSKEAQESFTHEMASASHGYRGDEYHVTGVQALISWAAGYDLLTGFHGELGFMIGVHDGGHHTDGQFSVGSCASFSCATAPLIQFQAGMHGGSVSVGYGVVMGLGYDSLLVVPIAGLAAKLKATRAWGQGNGYFQKTNPGEWYVGPEIQATFYGLRITTGVLFQMTEEGDAFPSEEKRPAIFNWGFGLGF